MATAAQPMLLEIPSRWDWSKRTRVEAIADIDRCAGILARGAEALCGLYLRICDAIRQHELSDSEIRRVLSKHFPPPRVAEFVTIAHAPDEVYHRYKAGFIGFRAALQECRYRLHSDDWCKRRKVRRAAERLIALLGSGEVSVCGHTVIVI